MLWAIEDAPKSKELHVIPLEDMQSHPLDATCKCGPVPAKTRYGDVLLHIAQDGRKPPTGLFRDVPKHQR
jgi:hypothetical protein